MEKAGEVLDFSHVTGDLAPRAGTDETADLSKDRGTPVTDDFGSSDRKFTSKVKAVQIDLGADAEDTDHLISLEARLRVAMAQQ